MPDDFVVARNPEPGSALPYLIRVPLGPAGVVLKARETWPRTAKVYCHRAEGWPAEPDVVERVATRVCEQRGPAIDLILDRRRESRSQLVLTRLRGRREAIFWQSPRTTRSARPGVRVPTRRAGGLEADELAIVVDSAEHYPYRFAAQQCTTVRRRLTCGDYAVEVDGLVLARRRAQEPGRPRREPRRRTALLPAERAGRAAAGGGGRGGEVRSAAAPPARAARVAAGAAGAQPGPLAERADRLRRDPAAGRGVDVPLPRRGARS